MKNNKDIQFEDITENIINNLDKPLFTYEEEYDYDKQWKRIKKHFFNKQRTRIILVFFLASTIILYLCTKKYINLPVIITISLIISIIITYLFVKVNAKRLSKSINNKLLFYKEYIIIKSKDYLFYFSYDEVLKVEENTFYFIIYTKRNPKYIYIDKEKLNNQFTEFFKKIQLNNNKKQEIKETNEDFFTARSQYLKDANNFCENTINEKNITKYCHQKEFKKQLLIKYFIYVLIPTLTFLSIIDHSFLSYIFLMIIVGLILYASLQNSAIEYFQNIIIRNNKANSYSNYKMYFYNNFILLKTNTEILKINFNDIIILEKDNLIFINLKLLKSKSFIMPLIIDKNKLTKNEFNNLYKKIHNKKC